SGHAGAVEIRDLTWLRPIRGEDAARLTLRLIPQAHGFAATIHGEAVLHAQAFVAAAPNEAWPLPAALANTQNIPPAQCRQTLNAQGIQHGPWLQALSALRLGADALEANLVRPQGEAMPLDPVMLDAAVQASVAFARGTGPTTVPYTVGRSVMQAPCASRMTALLRAPTPHADGSLTGLDISLIGPDGRVAVRMEGIASRRIGKADQKITCLIPAWSPVQLADAGTLPRNILDIRNIAADGLTTLADDDDILFMPSGAPSGNFAKDARASVLEALHLLRAVLAAKGEARRLRWTVVTTAAASAGEPAETEGATAGLHGFAGSLAKEYPHWNVRIADVEDQSQITPADMAALHAYKPSEAGILLARRAGHWLEMSLSRLASAPVDQGRAYRKGGVYVVIGGAGGVGRLWSEDVIRRCGAQIIWLGRRAPDATIAAHQAALGELGPRPEYIRA
ncbi:MAG: polyketide synthase dehydratase domain-containing protein, partial [Aestuariivirgaceae bacterium]|nr:polyketide synthase dehydratase domain-containing protein [Aestuariivirgaceae bacterium]